MYTIILKKTRTTWDVAVSYNNKLIHTRGQLKSAEDAFEKGNEAMKLHMIQERTIPHRT